MKLTLEQAQKLMDENDGNLNLAYAKYDELPEGLTVAGWMDLRYASVASLPEGLTVGEYLNLSHSQIRSLPEALTVGGYLDLSHTPISSLPKGLTVGGSLYLSFTPITSLPEGLTVGGYLDLSDTKITSLPEGLTVGNYLNLSHTQIISLPKGLTVGELYLHGSSITSLPEGLTVGRALDLSNTQITNLSKDLTVGEWLDLSHTQITSLPEGLSVGEKGVYLHDTAIDDIEHELQKVHSLQDGDYVEGKYLYADGILTYIKEKRQVNGYTLYIGKIPGHNIVSDGKNYAHCDKLHDGITDLIFKATANRELSVADLITMYRVITGDCCQKTQAFVNSIKNKREKYTVSEIIQIILEQYGIERFEKFFGI